jgi:anti-sigma B factor antagonist
MVSVSIEHLSPAEQRDDRTDVAGYLGFEVSVAAADGAATVRVKGELDCYTAPQLRSALLTLAEDGVRHVTLDIGGVQFVDSTGLSVLVGAMKRLRDHGGGMVVNCPTDATRKLFEITGLMTVLDVS